MIEGPIFPTQPIQPLGKTQNTPGISRTRPAGFDQVLEKEISRGLKFSKHAQERLQSRNIKLSAEDVERIQQAVTQARNKGSRDSLIIMDRLALVVSVKNNTVITAVDDSSIKQNVFTNIDSAVII